MESRRDFLKNASAGLLGITSVTGSSVLNKEKQQAPNVPSDITILFQGDSITDAGRNRAMYYPNEAGGMGGGYVYQIVAELLGEHPGNDLKCYNRGISGNKVFQLADRWEDDCLYLRPDVLSILIGVNDFWHTLTYGYKGTAEVYESDLRKLLDRTLNAYPDLKLIIAQPFAIAGGSAITEKWLPEFNRYQEAAQRIAEDYKAVYIYLQKIFDDALNLAPVTYWSPDGVHPTIAGAHLMKKAWMNAFAKLWG